MLLLLWAILLLSLCVNSENIALCRERGESVALECSSAGCPRSINGSFGMYLYFEFKKREEVLYYHSDPGPEKITPRGRYKDRIHKEGSLKGHTITINNLTMYDSGFYSCVYKKKATDKIKCNVYTLIVRDLFPEPPEAPPTVPCTNEKSTDKCPQLVIIIIATFAVSMLVTMMFIKMVLTVKHYRRARNEVRVAGDNVYEVMRNGLRPVVVPEPNNA